MADHTIFMDNLDDIERTIARVCGRAGWFAADADDFRSWVFLKLLEQDCRILNAHRGCSSMRTYIAVVTTNLMRDFRNSRLGKWRPSQHSRRRGHLAVKLDRLMNRDRLRVDQAIRSLIRRADCDASESDLRELAAGVPMRPRRRLVCLDDAGQVEGRRWADAPLSASERATAVERLSGELERCLEALDDEDQVIIRLRYWDGLSIADVARALGIPQKPLYRRVRRCLERLADGLTARGVDVSDVREVLVASAD